MTVVPPKALVFYSDDDDDDDNDNEHVDYPSLVKNDNDMKGSNLNNNSPLKPSSSSPLVPDTAESPTSFIVTEDVQAVQETIDNESQVTEEPEEQVSEESSELQATLHRLFELRKNGFYFNENLIQSFEFSNPGLYKTMVKFLDLDEFGSNYPKDQFDPHQIEVYADELTAQQNERFQRKVKNESAQS